MKLSALGACLGLLYTTTPSWATTSLPYRVVHEFAQGTWVENLYQKTNGDIFVTALYPNASLYLISGPASSSPEVSLVHTFDGIEGLLGIVETVPDVFVTFGGNFSGPGDPVNGSFSVFEVDYRPRNGPITRTITAIPQADFLNGVQNVPYEPTTILISDSTRGLVWRLDTLTGKYQVGIQVQEMAVVPGAPIPLGINGLHIHKGYLYWTNSFAVTIYRLAINGFGYPVPGAQVQTVAQLNTTFLDDLTTGPLTGDTIWVVSDIGDTLIEIPPGGNGVVVDGSEYQLSFAGATACQFGKTIWDSQTLYVTTSGGLADPVNGTLTQGGALIAVDTRGFRLYE